MNITFIADHIDLNGAGSNISLDVLARNLMSYGHSTEVLTLNVSSKNKVPSPPEYKITSLDLRDVESTSYADVLSKVSSVTSDTDIIHVFDPIYVPIFAAGRLLRSNATIVSRLNSYMVFCSNPEKMDGTCHKNCGISDRWKHDNNSTLSKFAKLPQYVGSNVVMGGMVNNIDEFFAQSPAVKRIYAEAGVDESKISVMTNFYDPDFSDKALGDNPFDSDKFNLLYVGRIKKMKGIDILIKAVDLADCDVRVDIVGDGRDKKEFESQAQQSSSRNEIHFHGWVNHDDLPEFYHYSDSYVHPGRWFEPSGRAVLEAMQYECPAIVSNIGGPPWIVGEAGLKFEPGNAAGLARHIERIATDEDLYSQLRENCVDRLEYFSPNRRIQAIEERYKYLAEAN